MADLVHSGLSIAQILGLGDTMRIQDPELLVTKATGRFYIRPYVDRIAAGKLVRRQERIYLQAAKRRDAGLAFSTRQDLRNIMSGIFSQARRWGYWKEANPALDATAGRAREARPAVKLSLDQTRQVLAALPADVRLICEVALYCTLRVSEVLGLAWKHVDFNRGLIQIRQRFYRGDLDVVKTRKAERDVPMGQLAQELAALYPGPGHEDEFVFSVRTHVGRWKTSGTCRDDRDINQHFLRPTAKELGVYRPGFGFHAFRREAVTEYSRSIGVAQAQRMAGHAKADMSQHYTLADMVEQERAVRQLQKKVRGVTKPPAVAKGA